MLVKGATGGLYSGDIHEVHNGAMGKLACAVIYPPYINLPARYLEPSNMIILFTKLLQTQIRQSNTRDSAYSGV